MDLGPRTLHCRFPRQRPPTQRGRHWSPYDQQGRCGSQNSVKPLTGSSWWTTKQMQPQQPPLQAVPWAAVAHPRLKKSEARAAAALQATFDLERSDRNSKINYYDSSNRKRNSCCPCVLPTRARPPCGLVGRHSAPRWILHCWQLDHCRRRWQSHQNGNSFVVSFVEPGPLPRHATNNAGSFSLCGCQRPSRGPTLSWSTTAVERHPPPRGRRQTLAISQRIEGRIHRGDTKIE